MSFWSWLFGSKEKVLSLKSTYYYLCKEADYPSREVDYNTFMLDVYGKPIGPSVSEQFAIAAEREGSCWRSTGVVLTVAEKIDGTWRWKRSPNLYGDNARGGPLVPMHSCAVDPKVIPLGSKLKIEGLPGIWVADDVGSDIVGNRIDLFTGAGHASGAAIDILGFGDHREVQVTLL